MGANEGWSRGAHPGLGNSPGGGGLGAKPYRTTLLSASLSSSCGHDYQRSPRVAPTTPTVFHADPASRRCSSLFVDSLLSRRCSSTAILVLTGNLTLDRPGRWASHLPGQLILAPIRVLFV